MSDDADQRRARGGLERTLRAFDMLESNLRSCSDPQLAETLRKIQRRKARQSSPFVTWLRMGGDRVNVSPISLDAEPTARPRGLDGEKQETQAGGAVILDRVEVTPELIKLKVQRPAGFDFEAGQSTKMGMAGAKRRYSIASAPFQDVLEFFIELLPGGEMSERLRSVSPGDRLTLDSPSGSFLLNEKLSVHLMVATVTGVAPFVSMLRQAFAAAPGSRGRHRFVLLHGASYQHEFGYREELEELATAHPDSLAYIPTVSRPGEPENAGWSGERGRVGAIVQAAIARFHLAPEYTCVYACGHSGMVDDMATRLGGQGFTVKREIYN